VYGKLGRERNSSQDVLTVVPWRALHEPVSTNSPLDRELLEEVSQAGVTSVREKAITS
jgi:hypothetical protein